MKAAGATEAELLHQKQLVDRAILAAAKSQKTVGTAGRALIAVDGVAISPFKTAAFSQLGHPFFILKPVHQLSSEGMPGVAMLSVGVAQRATEFLWGHFEKDPEERRAAM